MDRASLENAARVAAATAGIPVDVVFGVIQTESAWNPGARSSAGAIGLMQVMPWWAPKLGMTVKDLEDPVQNLTAGTRILADEIQRFGSVELAAMAYNAGAPAVQRAIQQAGGSRDPEAVSPYLPAETRSYWRKVLTWASHYAGQIGVVAANVEAAAEEAVETVKEAPATFGLLLGGILLAVLLVNR